MKKLGYWIHATRPKTLPAAAVPVLIGGALAMSVGSFAWIPWLLCLVFALLIQVGTNYANDYYDFLKGADGKERIGPKRAVASGWIKPDSMKRGMWLVFAIAFVAGLGLVPYGGWMLILVGVISILCGIAYTGGPYPLGYNGLGDIFVFVFFGWVATAFTYYVQCGTFIMPMATMDSWFWIFLSGCVPGALSTNLLVVNNVRDEPTDKLAGKRTLAVRYGRAFGRRQFALLNGVALLIPLLLALAGGLWGCLLVILMLPLMISTTSRLNKASSREDYQLVLEKTAILLMGTGLIFSVGLVI